MESKLGTPREYYHEDHSQHNFLKLNTFKHCGSSLWFDSSTHERGQGQPFSALLVVLPIQLWESASSLNSSHKPTAEPTLEGSFKLWHFSFSKVVSCQLHSSKRNCQSCTHHKLSDAFPSIAYSGQVAKWYL
ncbi:hypothetical protein D5086_006163 [Populus alba]|uniref:Uncharacterized protein n=1 Tax=Populus alba TaxID=43335 RepID=A0ACC4CL15_POPAL